MTENAQALETPSQGCYSQLDLQERNGYLQEEPNLRGEMSMVHRHFHLGYPEQIQRYFEPGSGIPDSGAA